LQEGGDFDFWTVLDFFEIENPDLFRKVRETRTNTPEEFLCVLGGKELLQLQLPRFRNQILPPPTLVWLLRDPLEAGLLVKMARGV
jgi:hypothetical protein